MLSRTTTLSLSGRASARRRQRRRTRQHTSDLYCRTNGCASFLQLDVETGIATCPICGFSRRHG
jgi:hypothetical protein